MRARGYHVGVRADDEDVFVRLRSMFCDHLVEASDRSDDFSLRIGHTSRGSPRLQPHLLHARCTLLRSRSVDRLLHRLDLALGVVDLDSLPGLVRVAGLAALIKGDRAILVPTRAVEHSSAMERVITGADARIAEDVATFLDVNTGKIVVLPGLSQDHAGGLTDDGISALPGRYTFRSLYWAADDIEAAERRSLGVVRMMRRLLDLGGLDPQEVLDGVVELSSRFAPVGLRTNVADLGKALRSLD